ncbi:GNAT family N-acetyltransferase [Vibrio splendidus]|uniref:GNAT family N-acetyltransferase n=2 Tax=Vibrio splendidus TaxID=29497 RepID=UPI000C838E14|nr:GNAT family N-acetyltransferase [Vibrio splendidus]PMI85224.1 3-oxoacyl-ACP synthase [Vibrio splendidus]PMK55391.1 3-oxoacyl-ACP synthase [Vibrio splendidus]
MTKADLDGAALVHQAAFVRQQNSLEWLQCNLNASPRFLNFIVESEGEIVGYIVWVQKSGFRPEAVLELEQLAVLPSAHGRGFGRKLILDSLPQVKHQLAKQGSTLKHVLVTTRADNFAQKLYQSTLGAEVETTISNLYSTDEVLMIARDVGERV